MLLSGINLLESRAIEWADWKFWWGGRSDPPEDILILVFGIDIFWGLSVECTKIYFVLCHYLEFCLEVHLRFMQRLHESLFKHEEGSIICLKL